MADQPAQAVTDSPGPILGRGRIPFLAVFLRWWAKEETRRIGWHSWLAIYANGYAIEHGQSWRVWRVLTKNNRVRRDLWWEPDTPRNAEKATGEGAK